MFYPTKEEAIEAFVKELNEVPQSWVQKIIEAEGDFKALPMWGTMWFIDWDLSSHIKKMTEENFGDDFDEEMEGEMVVVDTDGSPTRIYYYEVEDEKLIGIHAAGWNFYNGIWDKLYDILGLKWHKTN